MAMTNSMTHNRTPLAFLALVSALSLAPTRPTEAQDNGLIEGYASRIRLGNNPMLGGLSLSGYSGPFGLRLSGAVNLRFDDLTDQTQSVPCNRGIYCPPPSYDDSFGPAVSAWAADADLIFAPLRKLPVLRALVLGFSPYAFVGVGRSAVTPRHGPDSLRSSVSYGLGAYRALFQRLGVSGEARFRRPVTGQSTLTVAEGSAWEYRFGMSIRLGSNEAQPDSTTAARTATGAAAVDSDVVAARRAEDAELARETRLAAIGRVLDGAEELIGRPFRRGGVSPATGFDAAGLVQFLFKSEGQQLPGTARELSRAGVEVPLTDDSLQPGDLLFFVNDWDYVNHVAIYVGRDRFVHATESGGGVRYEVLDEGARGRWFRDHLVSARRLLDGQREQPVTPAEEGRDLPDRAPRPASQE